MALSDSRMTKKSEEDRTILIELDARGRHHTTRASDHCHPPAVRFFVIFQITHTIYFLERKNIESADRELTRKHWLRRKNFQIKVKFLQRFFLKNAWFFSWKFIVSQKYTELWGLIFVKFELRGWFTSVGAHFPSSFVIFTVNIVSESDSNLIFPWSAVDSAVYPRSKKL